MTSRLISRVIVGALTMLRTERTTFLLLTTLLTAPRSTSRTGIRTGTKVVSVLGRPVPLLGALLLLLRGTQQQCPFVVREVKQFISTIGTEIRVLNRTITFRLVPRTFVMVRGFGAGGMNTRAVRRFTVRETVTAATETPALPDRWWVTGSSRMKVEL